MPVPSAITDLSQTAGSNSPSGSESPITTDNYLRAHASYIALLSAAIGNGTTAGVLQSGTGGVTRTLVARSAALLDDDDYSTFANAKTAADAALVPLLADPTVNLTHEPPLGGGAVATNGYLRKGMMSGHLAIGNGPTGVDALVGVWGDEYYTNVQQEVRGLSYTVRNVRTSADEPTLGWDFFAVVGAVSIGPQNTQTIIGNQKAVVGELYFNAPSSGSYTVTKAHNFQASAPAVGANVTVSTWYGLVVNSPTGSGAITTGYGLYIEAISLPTTKAAIKINGQGNAGQIAFPNTSIKEDSSNKLEIDLNSTQLVLTNALVATTVGAAGGASAPPATPQGYWRVLIGGVERKIPYYVA